MPLVATSNTFLDDISYDTFQTRNHTWNMKFWGLKPNTKHDLYVDGVEYNWAAKQFGKDLGADLVSDSDGKLLFNLFYEFPFEGTYSLDMSNKNQNLGSGSSVTSVDCKYVKTDIVVELRAGNSVTTHRIPYRICYVQGHTNRSDHHGH